jgi:hypothetical protein
MKTQFPISHNSPSAIDLLFILHQNSKTTTQLSGLNIAISRIIPVARNDTVAGQAFKPADNF